MVGYMKRLNLRSLRVSFVAVLVLAGLISVLATTVTQASNSPNRGVAQPPVLINAQVGGVCGDLNGDDAVNVFDAIILLQIAVGLITPTPDQLVLGDVNQTETINVFDGIIILQHIVGLLTITDCGPLA